MKTYDLARGIAALNNNYLSLESVIKGFSILYPDDKKLQGLHKLTQDELSLVSVIRALTDFYEKDNVLLTGLINILESHEEHLDPFAEHTIFDAFSIGQIDSKQWLVDTIIDNKLELGATFICAGWYGTLAAMILENNINVDFIRSFDKDPTCAEIADIINRRWVKDNWKFKASTVDIMDIDYEAPIFGVTKADGSTEILGDLPYTIINTSCEHFSKENFNKWYWSIPDGCLIILQSNNYKEIKEHVNCVSSLNEFKTHVMFDELVFEGELKLEKYIRYMLIGYK